MRQTRKTRKYPRSTKHRRFQYHQMILKIPEGMFTDFKALCEAEQITMADEIRWMIECKLKQHEENLQQVASTDTTS